MHKEWNDTSGPSAEVESSGVKSLNKKPNPVKSVGV